jgi:hypothetical protein
MFYPEVLALVFVPWDIVHPPPGGGGGGGGFYSMSYIKIRQGAYILRIDVSAGFHLS